MRKLVFACLTMAVLVSTGLQPAGAAGTATSRQTAARQTAAEQLAARQALSGRAVSGQTLSAQPQSGQAQSGQVEAAAVSLPPAGTLQVRSITLDGARSYARTGDTLWVEDGTVSAFSASGDSLGTVSGIMPSTQLATNPSGSLLYSASWDDDSITAIDPVTRSVVHHWPALACPLSMVESGGYLLYSYACSNGNGVAALDLSTGQSERLLQTTGLTYLALAGGTLAIATPTLLSTYQADGKTLTPLATRSISVWEMAMAPDGSGLVASIQTPSHSMTTAQRLRTSDLSTVKTVVSDLNLTAVAWAPDGSTYAVGQGVQGMGDLIQLYSTADDRMVSRSVWPGMRWPYVYTVYHLSYSPTSWLIQGFGDDSRPRFVTASTQPGVAAGLSLTRTNPKVYGKRLLARVSAANCSPCAVRFTLRDTLNGTHTFTRTLVPGTPLDLSLVVRGNGTLSADLPATLNRVRVTRTRTYAVPLRMALRMTGTPTRSGTVLVYSARPTLRVAVAPGRKVGLVEWGYARFGGHWHVMSERFVSTNSSGVLRTRPLLVSARGDLTRVYYIFQNDGKNARAVVRSPLFRWP